MSTLKAYLDKLDKHTAITVEVTICLKDKGVTFSAVGNVSAGLVALKDDASLKEEIIKRVVTSVANRALVGQNLSAAVPEEARERVQALLDAEIIRG